MVRKENIAVADCLSPVLARTLPPETLVDLLKHPCCVGQPPVGSGR
jgi:hypothetical protein